MKTKILLLLLLVALITFGITACDEEEVAPVEHAVPEYQIQEIGTGSTMFYFEVINEAGGATLLRIHTDATTVGDALAGVGLIAGIQTDFGLMVTHVQGMRADFDEDDAWWAFYINGVMAEAGVSDTDIVAGATYAFRFTPA